MDPVQNLSIKIKKYPWTCPWRGVHGTGPKLGSMVSWSMFFFIWIQSNHRIEFSNLSFPIAHFPAGRLTCANSGENFVADPRVINGGRQNFLPRLERSIPYYTPHIRPQPGPDLPYQAPTYHIRPHVGFPVIHVYLDFVSLKVIAVFTKETG